MRLSPSARTMRVIHAHHQAMCRFSCRRNKIKKFGFLIMPARKHLFRTLGLHWPITDDPILESYLTYQILREHGI